MNILIAGTGTRGDVQPFVALGLALKARGHEVALRVPLDFVDWVRDAGLACQPMGGRFKDFLDTAQEEAQRAPYRAFRRAVDALWADQIRLAHEVAPTDVVIGNGAFPAGPTIAEAWGVPCVTALFQPTLLPHDSYPPIFFHRQDNPPWLNRALWSLWGPMLNLACRGPVNADRRKLGLAPIRDMQRHVRASGKVLLALDAAFVQPQPRWDFPHAFTGFWFLDQGTALDPEIEAFLARGDAPIYVGFGSMTSSDARALSRRVVAAAERLGLRLVLSAGWAGLGLEDLGEHVLGVSSTPHRALFPRMRAIVHHGGAGTTAAAAWSGRPQLVVPHLLDQHFWASRVERLGVGPKGLPIQHLTSESLAGSLSAALDPAMEQRASELGARLRATDGLAEAVRHIEELVESRQRRSRSLATVAR